MAKRLQHRGGTTAQHSSFTGAVREVTVDTTKNTLVVHDGATAGGHPLATATNFTSTGIDDNATSTAITINSSQNVDIAGTLAIDNTLLISNGTASGFLQTSGSLLQFGTSTAGDIPIYTNNAERMRIDSSGNVGIGTSSPSATLDVKSQINVTNPNNVSLQGITGSRFGYSPSWRAVVLGGTGVGVNNNTAIGYDPSGNSSGSFSGDGRELFFRNGVQFTTPNSADNGFHPSLIVLKDGNVGIGTTSPSQKLDVVGSIEVSDGIYIGGTGTANKLDDYEEGTFTPAFTGSTTAPSGVNYYSRNGYYTKIGRQVSVSMWLDLQSWSSAPTGTATIAGLPFATSNVTNGYHAFTVGYTAGFNTDNAPQTIFVGANQDFIGLFKNASADSRNNLNAGVVSASMNGTESIIVSGTYFTDA